MREGNAVQLRQAGVRSAMFGVTKAAAQVRLTRQQ